MDRFVVRLGDDQSSTCISSKRPCLDNVGYSTPFSLSLPLSLPLFSPLFWGEAEHSGGEASPRPSPH